jgi:hypothetical protein
LGAAHRLKLVVLPLNALMFKENLASGATATAVAVAAEEKSGFKDIL